MLTIGKKIIGEIDHIGFIVPDVRAMMVNSQRDFGIEQWGCEFDTGGQMYYMGTEAEEIRLDIIFGELGDGSFAEYITPLSGRSCHMDFLKATGGVGGMHHIGTVCESGESCEEIAAYLRSLGYPELHMAYGPGQPPYNKLHLFDTRRAIGTILELMVPVSFDELPPAKKLILGRRGR